MILKITDRLIINTDHIAHAKFTGPHEGIIPLPRNDMDEFPKVDVPARLDLTFPAGEPICLMGPDAENTWRSIESLDKQI